MSDDRKIRISPELMDMLCTRDADGNRLRVEWGDPDAGGFYTPRIHVDYTDNPLRQRLEEAEKELAIYRRTCGPLVALAAGESVK